MNDPPTEWDQAEEIRALERYAEEAAFEIGRWRRHFAALRPEHQHLLSNVPEKCRRAEEATQRNQFFLQTMLTGLKSELEGLGMKTPEQDESVGRTTLADAEKVRYVLKNLVRDWSAEGAAERRATYDMVWSTFGIWTRLPESRPDWTRPPRVLIPGCGLGRLVVEVASAGFEAEGNEFSYFMLLPSSFMLNHTVGVDAWTVYPWVLATCNQVSDEDQLRPVPVPDVEAWSLMTASQGSMSVVAGDFVDVYRREENRGAFDCVVTSFFIDTAHNVLEYLEVMYAVLKPGGVWVNFGPLLYHWADSSDANDLSVEISLQDILRIAESIGFKLLRKEFVSAPYLADPKAMYQTVYRAGAVFSFMPWDCCLSADKRKLKAYAQTTPFTFGEILRLASKFRDLDEDDSGRLNYDELCQCAEMHANPFARRLCRLFSEDGSERLTFKQFVNLTAIFSERTRPEIKLVWAFAMWDFDGDDLLGAEDIQKGLKLISSLPRKNDGNSGTKLSGVELQKVLERVFAEVDPMEDGLSFTDFRNVVSRMPDFFANFRLTV